MLNIISQNENSRKIYFVITAFLLFSTLFITSSCEVVEEYSIEIGRASAIVPDIFVIGDGSTVDFSVTVANRGSDISDAKYINHPKNPHNVNAAIIASSFGDLGYDDLMAINPIDSDFATLLDNNRAIEFDFSIDISDAGAYGNNFFYALIYVTDASGFPVDEPMVFDNLYQFNATPCMGYDYIHETWSGPEYLSGDEMDWSTARIIPSFGHWYYDSDLGAGSTVWYRKTVSDTSTYVVYWDDRLDGSGSYSADVQVVVWNDNASSQYASGTDGYAVPLTVSPTQTDIIISVTNLDASSGSFALGIAEQ